MKKVQGITLNHVLVTHPIILLLYKSVKSMDLTTISFYLTFPPSHYSSTLITGKQKELTIAAIDVVSSRYLTFLRRENDALLFLLTSNQKEYLSIPSKYNELTEFDRK